MPDPLAVHRLAADLLACACDALNAAAEHVPGQPACPCRVCVVPGTPAWDSCEDPCGSPEPGGQLTVNVVRIFPSSQFPIQDTEVRGTRGCPAPSGTAVELLVTILRCAPMVDESGCPPSCEALEAAAQIAHVDMWAIYRAVHCCIPQTGRRGRRFLINESRMVGPEGGCVGSELRVVVDLGQRCLCPGDQSP